MATLEDLNIPALTNMGNDEAIEHLRQVRLSRRIPVKKKSTKKTSSAMKMKNAPVPKLNKEQAANLLKILEGN